MFLKLIVHNLTIFNPILLKWWFKIMKSKFWLVFGRFLAFELSEKRSRAEPKILQLELWLKPALLGLITNRHLLKQGQWWPSKIGCSLSSKFKVRWKHFENYTGVYFIWSVFTVLFFFFIFQTKNRSCYILEVFLVTRYFS